MRALTGAMAPPSPVISVVMPWVILLAARPSTSTLYSDWPSMSMKPGAITSFEASMRRRAARPESGPMASTRAPTTHTSARNQGAPVPSTTRPPLRSRWQAEAGAAASKSSRRVVIRPRIISPQPAPKRKGRSRDRTCPRSLPVGFSGSSRARPRPAAGSSRASAASDRTSLAGGSSRLGERERLATDLVAERPHALAHRGHLTRRLRRARAQRGDVQGQGLEHLDLAVALVTALLDPRLKLAHQIELLLQELANRDRRVAEGLDLGGQPVSLSGVQASRQLRQLAVGVPDGDQELPRRHRRLRSERP